MWCCDDALFLKFDKNNLLEGVECLHSFHFKLQTIFAATFYFLLRCFLLVQGRFTPLSAVGRSKSIQCHPALEIIFNCVLHLQKKYFYKSVFPSSFMENIQFSKYYCYSIWVELNKINFIFLSAASGVSTAIYCQGLAIVFTPNVLLDATTELPQLQSGWGFLFVLPIELHYFYKVFLIVSTLCTVLCVVCCVLHKSNTCNSRSSKTCWCKSFTFYFKAADKIRHKHCEQYANVLVYCMCPEL